MLFLAALFALTSDPAAAQKRKFMLYTTNFPGFMGGSDSKPGILTELTRLAVAKKGYEIEQVFVPWPRAIMLTRKNENALIPGFTRLASRENSFV